MTPEVGTDPDHVTTASGDAAAQDGNQGEGSDAARRRAALLVALLLFTAAIAWQFAPVVRDGPSRVVPSRYLGETPQQPRIAALLEADLTFQAWLVARNARTLATHPFSLFETEHCAPTPRSMVYGIPMITMGIVGIPFVMMTDDPILTYNLVLASMILIAALAMYLLVADWTGEPAAGIAAGFLYAFHFIRLGPIHHPSVWDTTWTVFALYFARRWFTGGRWLDAIGLALACSLQIAASFYPFLAAVVLAPCVVVWLVRTYGFRKIRRAQLLVILAIVATTAAVVFGPYVVAQVQGETSARAFRVPALPSNYLAGGPLFLGYVIAGLSVVALLRGRRGLRPDLDGDPRFALLASALAVAVVAATWSLDWQIRQIWPGMPVTIPDFYALLSHVIPGLDRVRIVARLGAGVHLVLCVLAGIGAAVLIRAAGRYSRRAAAFIVLVAMLDTVGSALPGYAGPNRWRTIYIHPGEDKVAFFRELGSRAERGAIFELPFDASGVARIAFAPERIHLSFHHGRRTAACFGSYKVPGREGLAELVSPRPDVDGVKELSALGFSTIVVHDTGPFAPVLRKALDRMAAAPHPVLGLVLESDGLVAYEILPVDAPAAPGPLPAE